MGANPTLEQNGIDRPALDRVGLYAIEQEISRGSAAVIYRASNSTFQYQVALKILRNLFKEDVAIARYFIREAQDGARLIHPNIVRIYDAGFSDGQACIAQALVEGATLAQLLRNRSRPFSLNETLRILEEVSNGLEYAHAQQYIHGNLKPSNIFRTQRGRILIADFGVASPVAILRPPNYPQGRATYRSPEQRRGDLMLSPMSDVFSLALIAVEMLTGQLPYGVTESISDDAAIVAPYIHAGMLANVQVDEPRVRDDLASILNRALSEDPSQRYPSVAGFVQALAGAAQSRLDTLQLSAPASVPLPFATQSTTTALALYKAAPLAVIASQSRALMVMPKASKEERQDMSWIASVVGSLLIALLVLGVMNTMTELLQTTAPVEAPDPQTINTVFYAWFERIAAILRQSQIMNYFSPFYGLGAAVILLVLLFQRELLRTFGIDPENRYWRFLGFAIPPATVAFFLLLILQIFRMVQVV